MPPRPPRLVLTKKTDVIWRASGEKEIVNADFSASQPVRGDGQRDPIPVHARATRARLRLHPRQLAAPHARSEEHTSELQSRENLVCRLLLEKKKNTYTGAAGKWC